MKVFVVCIIVALVVFIYVKSLTNIAQNLTLIQVDLQNIHPDHIHEKQPILVYDKIVNPIELLKTVFKYYFFSIKKTNKLNNLVKNTFLVLHAQKQNALVNIKHPKQKQVLTINMNKYNVLLIPFKWTVVSVDECNMFLADSFMFLIFKFFCLH